MQGFLYTTFQLNLFYMKHQKVEQYHIKKNKNTE